jgi:hypothetical protein
MIISRAKEFALETDDGGDSKNKTKHFLPAGRDFFVVSS